MPIKPARNQHEVEDLINRLDAYVASGNKSCMFDIVNYQSKHQQYMIRKYNRFIGQFETFFCCMTDYAHNINYLKKDWPANRGMQYVIITKALKQLNSSFILLNNGAYEDSIAVIRSAYESFIRVIFISLNPKYAGNAYKFPDQKVKKFNATNIVNVDLGLEWTQYHIMCAFAHSNMYQVMETLINTNSEDKKEPITLTYKIDEDMIKLITGLINFVITVFMRAYDELFVVDVNDHPEIDIIQPHIDLLHEYALIRQEELSTQRNEYWRRTAVDIDCIFELLQTIDANNNLDWKKEWKIIRESHVSLHNSKTNPDLNTTPEET